MQWGPTSANTPSSSWRRGNPRKDPDTPYRRTVPLVTELAETLGVERRVTDYSCRPFWLGNRPQSTAAPGRGGDVRGGFQGGSRTPPSRSVSAPLTNYVSTCRI